MPIRIPHSYSPRGYQLPLLQAMDSGIKRAVCVWHRRCGKDKTLINLVAKKMLERPGSYYYFFPEFNQGRKVLWDGMDRDGFKFTDHIPAEIRESTNNQEMKITLRKEYGGSVFQIVGTDNYHAIRGTNPVGCVFSEYALQNPLAWDVVAPILNENGGWAVFNSTPLGKNHLHTLYQAARNDPAWFTQLLTIDDTKREDGSPVIDRRVIDMEVATGKLDRDTADQEYWCSFEASTKGAYYSEAIKLARQQNRISPCEVDLDLLVDTWWDLGRNDSNSIWFAQKYGRMIRLIDFDQRSGESIKFYVHLLYQLHKEKGYRYGTHVFPHDIMVTDYSADQSRLNIFIDTYKSLFGVEPDWKRVDAAKSDSRGNMDRIEAVRFLFPRFHFNDANPNVRRGVDYLSQYRKEWDEDNRVFRLTPVHDFTSHCSDALGTGAMGFEEAVVEMQRRYSTFGQMTDPYAV